MDYRKEYEKWLSYDFLDKDIKKELKSIHSYLIFKNFI